MLKGRNASVAQSPYTNKPTITNEPRERSFQTLDQPPPCSAIPLFSNNFQLTRNLSLQRTLFKGGTSEFGGAWTIDVVAVTGSRSRDGGRDGKI